MTAKTVTNRRYAKTVVLAVACTMLFAACVAPSSNAAEETETTDNTGSVVPAADGTTTGGAQLGADVPPGSVNTAPVTGTFVGSDTISSVLSIAVAAGSTQTQSVGNVQLKLITGSPNAVRIGATASSSISIADIASGKNPILVRPGTANAVLVYTVPTTGVQQSAAFTLADPAWDADTSTFTVSGAPSAGGTIDRDMARLTGLTLGTVVPIAGLPASFTAGNLYIITAGLRTIGDCVIGPDASCSGADLFRADLVGVDMSRSDLSQTNFAMSTLFDANFSNASFENAELFRSDVSNTDLTNANFTLADLTQAVFTNADFTGANLTESNMWRSELSGATLSDADLTRAALQQSTLLESTARNAIMPGASMFRADLSDSDFTGARMNDVNMAQGIAQRTRFTGANMSYMDLSKADLKFADLSGADLSYAQLAGADLAGANLAGANLTGAVLWMTDLRAANLAGITWTGATCPNGLRDTKQFFGVCWPLEVPLTVEEGTSGPLGVIKAGPRPGIARAGDFRDCQGSNRSASC